jgi:hypothetical protein
MARRSGDFGEFVRRSLRAAAESAAVGEDGLDRIWTRLAAARPPDVADHGEIAVREEARAGLVLVAREPRILSTPDRTGCARSRAPRLGAAR